MLLPSFDSISVNGSDVLESIEMAAPKGRYLALSAPRIWMNDILHFGRQVPTASGERPIRVGEMAALRKRTPQPPSWSAILMKAISLAAQARPELRRAFLPRPWARLYEHPCSVASFVVEREFRGEPAVFYGVIHEPENRPLQELSDKIKAYKTEPVERFGCFRRLIRSSKLPQFIRRPLGDLFYNWNGPGRCHYFGTFALNSIPSARSKLTQTLSPITQSICYYPVLPDGTLTLHWAFDHRVYDGLCPARAISDMEQIIRGPLLEEMRQIADQRGTLLAA